MKIQSRKAVMVLLAMLLIHSGTASAQFLDRLRDSGQRAGDRGGAEQIRQQVGQGSGAAAQQWQRTREAATGAQSGVRASGSAIFQDNRAGFASRLEGSRAALANRGSGLLDSTQNLGGSAVGRLAATRDLSGSFIERSRMATHNHGAVGGLRVRELYQHGGDRFFRDVFDVRQRYGEGAVARIEASAAQYGPGAARGMASAMAWKAVDGDALMRVAGPSIVQIQQTVRDPAFQERAIEAAVIGAAVAYYGYTHSHQIKYQVARTVLQNTVITVDGTPRTAEQLITDAVLSQVPMLAGTRLAEDPAAVLVFGAVAVGREDILGKAALVPDGRGGAQTLPDALAQHDLSTGTAADALLMGMSVEGAMLSAAEQGHMGRHGVTFAATQRQLDARLGAK